LALSGLFLVPALSQAASRLPATDGSVETVICGEISNTNSPYGQEEQEATGYVVRVDCNLDQKPTLSEPLAVVMEISPAHKGVVTKFTQAAVDQAVLAGDRNPRAKKAYACMSVIMDGNPCLTLAKKAYINKINEMHASPNVLPAWIEKARKALGK